MSGKFEREVVTGGRRYRLEVDAARFEQASQGASILRKSPERKFNLRIKHEDLALLDALATHAGVPRSALINRFVHDILLDELMGIDDLDTRLLLALSADGRATYDDRAECWMIDAVGTECQRIIDNIMTYNSPVDRPGDEPASHSDSFLGLQQRLETLKK